MFRMLCDDLKQLKMIATASQSNGNYQEATVVLVFAVTVLFVQQSYNRNCNCVSTSKTVISNNSYHIKRKYFNGMY